jgi:DNA-binding MarR family transcriptional regulator
MVDSEGMHYRSDLVQLLTDLQGLWSHPAFGRRMVGVRGYELSPTEVRVLWTLGGRGPMRSSALADLLDTGAPTVSKAVARLEQRGHVRRIQDAVDGRAQDVMLTDHGIEVARSLFEAGDDMMVHLLEGWDGDDVRALTTYVERLVGRARTFATDLDTDDTDSDGSAPVL